MATVSDTSSSTGDYYQYYDTADSFRYAYSTPTITWDSGWTYPNTDAYDWWRDGSNTPEEKTKEILIDYAKYLEEKFPNKTKKKGDDKMTALWRVIILDPVTEISYEDKVVAKTEDMAIHKALKEIELENEDELEINVEKLIEFKKRTKKSQLKEALKEAMEE